MIFLGCFTVNFSDLFIDTVSATYVIKHRMRNYTIMNGDLKKGCRSTRSATFPLMLLLQAKVLEAGRTCFK